MANTDQSKQKASDNSRFLMPVKTTEEAKERGARGGRASGEARRKKASLRRAAEMVLSLQANNDTARMVMQQMGLEDDEMTNATMVTARMVIEASEGNVGAYKALAEALPEEQIEAGDAYTLVDTASVVPGAYSDIWRDIMAGGHSEYIGESGRGSLKTTILLATAPIVLMLKDPKLCGVAFRRVGNTLRDSIYAAFCAAIERLGLGDEFECRVSPMMVRRKSTGQVVLFRGLDDEQKAKSLQLPHPDMYLGFACWEEFDQFRGEKQVRTVQQTIKRGQAPHFWTFRAFNTPVNDQHWAHKYTERQEERGEALVIRATYLDVPREFLGEEFHAEAEALKEIDEDAYNNEYMGKCTGRKGKVFLNLTRRDITQEERDGFAWQRCGIDWGYVSDPWVIVRVAYDRKHKRVFVWAEDKGLRLSDEQSAERARKLLADDDGGFSRNLPANRCIADCAERKAIATWRACGIECVAVRKWKGSVEQGLKWLQTRQEIVIDRNCPLAWSEFSAYDYETDDDGQPIEGAYPDKDNHTIDAVRYALSELITNKKEV